jgi:hypothetical protein
MFSYNLNGDKIPSRVFGSIQFGGIEIYVIK